MAAVTEGLKSGILSSNVLLADSGAATDYSGMSPVLWMSSSVAATIEFQARNAANSANNWAHRFYVSAASPFVSPAPSGQVILQEGERIRLVLISGILGDVQGTMIY